MSEIPTEPPRLPERPWQEIMDTGLLWMINQVIFHPRGYAMYISLDGEGVATGWGVMGNGRERWAFVDDDPKTQDNLDQKFSAFRELLKTATP